jgi:hypothetical protein
VSVPSAVIDDPWSADGICRIGCVSDRFQPAASD